MENVVSDAAGDEQLLADLDDLDELRRVGVEVDHVAGLLGGRRPGVHGHADVGLGERRRVVGAVAGHRDQPAALLLPPDQRELVLGRGLGQHVVDPRLVGDRAGGALVVAGDHDRPDAHAAELVEPLPHALLDDVLEVDDAEHPGAVPVDAAQHERGAAGAGDRVDDLGARRGGTAPPWDATQPVTAPAAPLRSCRPSGRSTPLIRVCAVNGTKVAPGRSERSRSPNSVLARTTTLRPSGVSSASEASWAASATSFSSTPADREELDGLPVAERDRAGLVEQQRVHVAGGLDRAAAHREHVALHQPVHAGDADRRQQRADRRRDEADDERDEHRDRLLGAASRSRTAAGSRRRAGRRSSASRAGCSARSRSASSAGRRPRRARSSGRRRSPPACW